VFAEKILQDRSTFFLQNIGCAPPPRQRMRAALADCSDDWLWLWESGGDRYLSRDGFAAF
jgi:hypothetical protein